MPIPRRFDRRPPERDSTRINERIRVPKVRLIGADGEQLGILDINDALEQARSVDLDLVEVAPDAKPPVTRLLDYSKYKYEQEQKQKQARKHQQQVNVREIKLRPKIADHDYGTKKGHVMRFLKHGDKVKVTIMFRGREQAHPERGRALLKRLFDDLEGMAVIESDPLQEGRNMSMLVAPSSAAREDDAKEDDAKGADVKAGDGKDSNAKPAQNSAAKAQPAKAAEAKAEPVDDPEAKAEPADEDADAEAKPAADAKAEAEPAADAEAKAEPPAEDAEAEAKPADDGDAPAAAAG